MVLQSVPQVASLLGVPQVALRSVPQVASLLPAGVGLPVAAGRGGQQQLAVPGPVGGGGPLARLSLMPQLVWGELQAAGRE